MRCQNTGLYIEECECWECVGDSSDDPTFRDREEEMEAMRDCEFERECDDAFADELERDHDERYEGEDFNDDPGEWQEWQDFDPDC